MLSKEDVKNAIVFQGSNLAKMESNAQRYRLTVEQVKDIFIQTMFDALMKAGLGDFKAKQALRSLSQEDLREQWYAFTKQCNELKQKSVPAPSITNKKKQGQNQKAPPESKEKKGKRISPKDIEELIVFEDKTLELVNNTAEQYQLSLSKAKVAYLKAVYSTILEANPEPKESAKDVFLRLTKEEWKKLYRKFLNTVYDIVGVNRGDKIVADDVRKCTNYKYQALVTKIQNVSDRYDLDVKKAEELYTKALYRALKDAKPQETEAARDVIDRFTKEDWRNQWFLWMEEVQKEVSSKDEKVKEQMQKVKAKVAQIVKNDKIKAKLRIKKLEAKLEKADPALQIDMKKEISQCQTFLEYADKPRCINHFVDKYMNDRTLTTFMFK